MPSARNETSTTLTQRSAGAGAARDRQIAELAAAQHGVVALDQLRGLGLSASAVRMRVAAGRLHRIHRGVYAVGHALIGDEGWWMAAVLACGPGAVLSHRSAGALRALRPDSRRSVDVTVPGRKVRHRPAITVHRTALGAEDVTVLNGIPCTTLARTLVDLAGVVDRPGLGRAVERAERLRVFDLAEVDAALDRAAGRRGSAPLRAVLDGYRDGVVTRSGFERRFLAFCAERGLPEPRVNVWLPELGYEADFLWPEARLVVETDTYRTHGGHAAFERDRTRDRRLRLRHGLEVVRLTPRMLEREREEIAADLRERIGNGEGGIRTLEAA